MIPRRHFTAGLCACALGGLSACSTHRSGSVDDVRQLEPGQRPDMDTDEAGLWMAVEKAEAKVKSSQARIRGDKINDLINDIMGRLAPSYRDGIRCYVMRIPQFNATMMPNGATQIWTGLLLRSRNESQVATVLGHEFGHYLKRHSLQRQRDTRDKANIALIMGVGLAAFGAPAGSGDLVNLMVAGTIQAFSRDNEREADAIGLDVMSKAGYDPYEAPEIWRRLIRENDAAQIDLSGNLFFASHPPPSERIETLQRMAEDKGRPKQQAPDRLREALAPIRQDLLMDQLSLGQFARTEALYDMLVADGGASGEPLYFKGELYRRRGDDGDHIKALEIYRQSLTHPGAMPEAHRGLGLVLWRSNERNQAREHFRTYLQARPGASDRDAILYYLGDER